MIYFISLISKKVSSNTTVSGRTQKMKVFIILSGLILIVAGLVFNERVINSLVLPNTGLKGSYSLQIIIFDGLLIAVGVLLIMFRKRIASFLQGSAEKISSRKDSLLGSLRKKVPTYTRYLVIASIISLILKAPFPLGKAHHLESVLEHKEFLSGADPVSMANANKEIFKHLDNMGEDSTILALEHNWFQAFTDVDLDTIHQIWSLPPFTNSSQEIERELCELDVIFVSPKLSTAEPSIATQAYLRYLLHIKPIVEDNVCAKKIVRKQIKEYGEVYYLS